MGKRASVDIFPTLVTWLDKYAEDSNVNNPTVRATIKRTISGIASVKVKRKGSTVQFDVKYCYNIGKDFF